MLGPSSVFLHPAYLQDLEAQAFVKDLPSPLVFSESVF
jgi:hypothetical protein